MSLLIYLVDVVELELVDRVEVEWLLVDIEVLELVVDVGLQTRWVVLKQTPLSWARNKLAQLELFNLPGRRGRA